MSALRWKSPPARGPQSEPLRKICEAMALGVKGVKSVTAVLTAHEDHAAASTAAITIITTRPSPRVNRQPPPAAGRHSRRRSNIIAVASGKGGVGKSTVAVNLALALSRLGLKVGLAGRRYLRPLACRACWTSREKPESDGQTLKPIEKYGIKTMSIGFLVKEDEAMIWRGPMVQ